MLAYILQANSYRKLLVQSGAFFIRADFHSF